MKNVLFASLFLLFAINCFSQNYDHRSGYTTSAFGIKGGLNIATEYNGKNESSPRAGIHVGFLGEFFCSPKIGFQPEILFSMQGGKYKDERGNKHTDKMNYINLPLVLKIYLDRNRRLSMDTGLQPGYMMTFKYNGGGGWDNDLYWSIDNKFDLSFLLGITYRFGILELGMRHNLGLINPVKGLKTKNSVLQLSAGIRL